MQTYGAVFLLKKNEKNMEVQKMNKETQNAIIRLLIGVIILVNAFLTARGINPIPFDENLFTEGATYVITAGIIVWRWWWKNNNVTPEAQYAQRSLNALKDDYIDDGEIPCEDE